MHWRRNDVIIPVICVAYSIPIGAGSFVDREGCSPLNSYLAAAAFLMASIVKAQFPTTRRPPLIISRRKLFPRKLTVRTSRFNPQIIGDSNYPIAPSCIYELFGFCFSGEKQ